MSGVRTPVGSTVPLPVKRALKRGVSAFTLPTSGIRMLPDYVIVGAQRAGTTSLYFYLVQHPSVVPGVLTKEVHFFDTNFRKGVGWYRTHFPTTLHKRYAKLRRGVDVITGEATPYYLFHPHAPRRMAKTLPGVRLIVMLRDPVQRAYSHYQHELTLGFERLSFEEALDAEPDRLAGEVERMKADPTYESFNHQHYSYVARGLYLDQLRAWHSVYPPEQMLVIKTEDFFREPELGFRRVLDFLGLPAWSPVGFQKHNAHPYSRGMAARTRRRLEEYFAEPNERLYDYLGKDFAWAT